LALIAGCDPRPERRSWAEQQGVPVTYADAETLLQREKPELVLIATPPDSHRDLCLLGLQYGAHVLCEKPFVSRPEEADDVAIAAARQPGRPLSIISAITREAPLASLFVAFLFGISVARRR